MNSINLDKLIYVFQFSSQFLGSKKSISVGVKLLNSFKPQPKVFALHNRTDMSWKTFFLLNENTIFS